MLAAIAQQEAGYIWSALLKHNLSLQKILELCVGTKSPMEAIGATA